MHLTAMFFLLMDLLASTLSLKEIIIIIIIIIIAKMIMLGLNARVSFALLCQ